MNKSEQFWDRIADKYARQPVADRQAFDRMLEQTRRFLAADDTVLDYGCGTGSISIEIANDVKQIHAIDISSRMIAIATGKSRDIEVGNITFAHTDIFDDRYRKESFDAILAFHVLHLVEDTQKVLRRINELLKPGGVFISTTACLGEHRVLFSVVLFLMRKLGLAPYVRMLRISELDDLLVGEKFLIIEKERANRVAPDCFIVSQKVSE